MKKVKVEAVQILGEGGSALSLVSGFTLALAFIFLGPSACGRTEEPSASSAATPVVQKATSRPADAESRVETSVVAYSSVKVALTLAGKVAYGEDRYSKISSPLQGRVVEVRAHLGDHVKAGDVLLVIDSAEMTAGYSAFVKEYFELDCDRRAARLAKGL